MTAAADTATPSNTLPDGLGDAARAFISSPQRLLIGAERAEAADGRTFDARPRHRPRDRPGAPRRCAGCRSGGQGGTRGVR